MIMETFLSVQYSRTSPFFASILAGKRHPSTTSSANTPPLTLSLKQPTPDSDNTSTSSFSSNFRRPSIPKPPKTSPASRSKPTPSKPKISTNPLRNLVSPTNTPNPESQTPTNNLRLSTIFSPPPPPPPLPQGETLAVENETRVSKNTGIKENPTNEIRQEGKIFVGNLPSRIKKHELAELFRQFGPISNVILMKGHHYTERDIGFGFVTYGGPTADKSAMKAEEFDGVEFHGRVLTVKLDDGRRMKGRSAERAWRVDGADGAEHKSKWHEEKEISRWEFRKVLETQPENCQAVVQAFEKIKKVLLLDLSAGIAFTSDGMFWPNSEQSNVTL